MPNRETKWDGGEEVQRMSEADLRAFVLDWADGRIVSSHTVPGDLLASVFIPLAFGAIHGAPESYIKSVALIYANLSQDRTCGMAVNGFPIFFSCRFIHREDWKLARDMIEAELKRRKEFLTGGP